MNAPTNIIMWLVGVVLAGLLLTSFGEIAISVFGILPCTGCDATTRIFVFGFLPVAGVFIVLYAMWEGATHI